MQLKPWPSGPEAAPNADQIAVAMVAAAIETDDSERLAEAVGPDGGGLAGLTTRARWLALEALNTLWPRCGVVNLAEKLGVPRAANPASSLIWARRASWWSDHAVNRVIDAI